jgi:poly-gamma-glutamate synthesis protein (capsule biosynthesis protein)
MKKAIAIWCVAFILLGVYAGLYFHYKNTENKEIIPADTDVSSSVKEETKDDTVYIKISAAGDCTLGVDINGLGGGCFDDEFEKAGKNYSHFLENVKPIFEKDDLTIVNFEGTLSESGTRQDKEYAFRGNPQYAKILSKGYVEAANIANNHSMDYGEIAFNDTKKHLEENGVKAFGKSEYEIIDIKGIRIGLLGTSLLTYAERINFSKVMENLKLENPDIIIASFHWGEENSYTPTNDQINYAHLAIDLGADLVLGHHPHVLQGIEKYKGKYIAYSLGNFCFGGNRSPKDKDTMIFTYTFAFKYGERLLEKESIGIIPCSISSVKERNNFKPTILSGDEYERVKNKILELSQDFYGIDNIEFIK